MSISIIPKELCQEILIRLPVNSVSKCKCVCRSWRSLISSSDFVKSHLQLNKNNTSSNSLLIVYCADDVDAEPEYIYSISYDLLVPPPLLMEEIEQESVNMRYPFRSKFLDITLLGSCDGLVFLRQQNIESDSGLGGVDFLCVWNPATREYKKIPPSPNAYLQMDVCIHGLSYDCKNDDYKFLIGTCRGVSGLTTLVEVFSLRSNSWETFKTPYRFPHDELIKQKSGVLVNGDLHWLARAEHGVCIVYLDSSSEMPSFKEIQLPVIPNLRHLLCVGVLEEGCLCVVTDNNSARFSLGRVEVWEIQVYGVPESWTKRYVISNETITLEVTNIYAGGLRIIWSFKDGSIVFLSYFSVVLYDPKHGTAYIRDLDRFEFFVSEVNYVESLVSIHILTSGTKRIEESTEDDSTEDETTEEESAEEESQNVL